MGIMRGLKEMDAIINRPEYDSDRPKVRWLKLEDGQSVKIRFANELDEDSPNFDGTRSVAIVVKEHTNPKDYKRKAVDTMDTEGRDWAEEMHRQDPKAGWQARFRFYVNVLVDDGMEAPYMAVWSQGVGKQSAFNSIKEYALDTGSISNRTWRLKRVGTGVNTSYVLLPGDPDTEPFNWSNAPETFDLEKSAVRHVPYAEQERFYLGFDTPTTTGSTTTNIDW